MPMPMPVAHLLKANNLKAELMLTILDLPSVLDELICRLSS